MTFGVTHPHKYVQNPKELDFLASALHFCSAWLFPNQILFEITEYLETIRILKRILKLMQITSPIYSQSEILEK